MSPPRPASAPRLLSLDVYRGLVILAMLIVNNLGDYATTGYFWKHADWPEPWPRLAFAQWWHDLASGAAPWYSAFTQLPVWKHCTLADFVMPSFMLIIGLAMPLSLASSLKRGHSQLSIWLRAIKRAALLVLLGWILCYFRDQFAPSWRGQKPWNLSLGMDVLQLLGVAYLLARILYQLPRYPRLAAALLLFLWHWALLRFASQGPLPRGTFEEVLDPILNRHVEHSAVRYAYNHWPIWNALTLHLGRVTIGWVGLLSVPPAAATMLLGSLAGDHLQRTNLSTQQKTTHLALAGILIALVGLAWSFDLPFNKPRWTPCYLLWVSGAGFLTIALLQKALNTQPSPSATVPVFQSQIENRKSKIAPSPPSSNRIHPRSLVVRFSSLLLRVLRALRVEPSHPPQSQIANRKSQISPPPTPVPFLAYPLIVLGSNALAAYFITILAKVLLLNTPRIQSAGQASMLRLKYATASFITLVCLALAAKLLLALSKRLSLAAAALLALPLLAAPAAIWTAFLRAPTTISQRPELLNLTEAISRTLKSALGPWPGGWTFTLTFIAFWWLVLDLMYRRKIIWKI